jgi:hypothetical protein
MVRTPTVSVNSKIRLVALYGLRYEFHDRNSTEGLLGLVETQHPEAAAKVQAVRDLISQYAGSRQRQENIFGGTSFFARAQSGIKGLKGVENVYTQHTPLIHDTLNNLIKGKLKKTTHPYFDPGDGSLPSWAANSSMAGGDDGDRPQNIFVFMVGGTTYEELVLLLSSTLYTRVYASSSVAPRFTTRALFWQMLLMPLPSGQRSGLKLPLAAYTSVLASHYVAPQIPRMRILSERIFQMQGLVDFATIVAYGQWRSSSMSFSSVTWRPRMENRTGRRCSSTLQILQESGEPTLVVLHPRGRACR